MNYVNQLEFAKELDQSDPLKSFRTKFYIPEKDGKDVIYFCGNSLGLQPENVDEFVNRELRKWRDFAVEGHFTEPYPWVDYHKFGRTVLAELVGAEENEVVAFNSLTVNLHLMLASFYQPEGVRNKIIIESGAFPSDHFAVTSHMKIKGVDPAMSLVEVAVPEDGYLSTAEIIDAINDHKNELALVLLPGIQYYTGQFFRIREITRAAHDVGAFVGFDLAHAIGNVPVSLHDDDVDFAVWCSYKYLNSGPGNVGGGFIHQKHNNDPSFPRLAGWWGQDETIRFKMENNFQPTKGIDGWMLSNINALSTSAHLAALEIFKEAGMENLRKKSITLTGYLEFLLKDSSFAPNLKILTPGSADERGCQLSLYFLKNGRNVYDFLTHNGVMLDWREPNVMRAAPAPLYNTFEDVFRFVKLCEKAHDQLG